MDGIDLGLTQDIESRLDQAIARVLQGRAQADPIECEVYALKAASTIRDKVIEELSSAELALLRRKRRLKE